MTFKVNGKIYHILIIQFKPTSVFLKRAVDSNCESSTEDCHDLVGSKNTYTEACSDNLSPDCHISFLRSLKCIVRVSMIVSAA